MLTSVRGGGGGGINFLSVDLNQLELRQYFLFNFPRMIIENMFSLGNNNNDIINSFIYLYIYKTSFC